MPKEEQDTIIIQKLLHICSSDDILCLLTNPLNTYTKSAELLVMRKIFFPEAESWVSRFTMAASGSMYLAAIRTICSVAIQGVHLSDTSNRSIHLYRFKYMYQVMRKISKLKVYMT